MNSGEGISQIIGSKSKTFIAFCFCFIFGVGSASLADMSHDKMLHAYAVIFGALFFAAYFWQNAKARFCLFALVFGILGVLNYLYFIPEEGDPSHLKYYFGERLNITAAVGEEPMSKISSAEYVLTNITKNKRVSGKMLLRMPLYPEIQYGESLDLLCTISAPESFQENFRYDRYLAVKGIFAVCDYPEILSVRPATDAGPYGYLLKLKNFVRRKVASLWPEPAGSLMAGLIYGDKSGLPKRLSDDFRRTGLSHIIAVSGYNVSVVAGFLLALLITAGFYRRQALIVALLGVFVFVLFVGASASAVRAGIMGSIILIGQYLGRPSRAIPALVFAAALMVALNPLILIWDAGFQLSCLATAGIILAPKTKKKWLEPAITTLAATVATLPLVLMQFGRLSVVSLPVNLMVIWLIPWLMLLGFVSVFIAFLFLPAGIILASFAHIGLNYVIYIAERLSAFRIASVEIGFNPWLTALSYAVIIIFVRKYAKT